MRGIVICNAGVGILERKVTPAEECVLGIVEEVSNSYSEAVIEVEVEGEGEGRRLLFMGDGGGGYGGGCDWWVLFDYWRGGRDRGRLDDGAGGVEPAKGFVKGCGGRHNVLVK